MATPLAILAAGGRPVFVDCNRDDLCMSFEDFEAKAERHRPRAAVLVHIGGHLAFESERIAAYCRDHGIFLLEDCAHAHGASWDGRRPGTFGDAGVFSLYATKTISTGEGGVLVSGDPRPARARAGVPRLRQAGPRRARPELPDERVHGRARRSSRPSAWRRSSRGRTPSLASTSIRCIRTGSPLPDGMVSGLYKYIVFDPIERSTGKVYDEPCHRIMGTGDDLPNTDWVAEQPLVRPALLPAVEGHA